MTVNEEKVEVQNPTIVPYNSEVVYIVTKDGYEDKTETLIIKENTKLDINMEKK